MIKILIMNYVFLCTGINEKGEIMINDPATGKKATLASYTDRPKFSLYFGASARK